MTNEPDAGNPPADAFPIFLLGSGRSGTTLLQKILNSADDVMIWGEHGGFLKKVANAYFHHTESAKVAGAIFGKNRVAKNPNLDFNRLKLTDIDYCWMNWYGRREATANFAGLIESFFHPPTMTKRHWGFKEIRYGGDDRTIEMLAELFPNARFVFIARNPVDVIASQAAMGWEPKTVLRTGWKQLAETWAAQNRGLLEFQRANEDRTRFVRFESMISKDSGEVEGLFEWLGFETSDRQGELVDLKEGILEKRRMDGKPHRAMFSERKLRHIARIVRGPSTALGY
ncbi:MAG: sulfotransferase [Phycisphaerales bacterium]|nr:sulfotransferase [Phycisphaerales bacterium]MDG1978684.1 sulfotransferase [Phycisphaerales bacterium]MDG2133348.1 sulfotransferase [Phycisphaerales bacterium]